MDPAAGTGVRVRLVPLVKFAVHVLGQVIPDGLLVTVPVPVPDSLTVTANVGLLNVAVTVVFAVSVTLHVAPVPLHPPPLQPANVDPVPGISDTFTTAPFGKLAEHVPVTTPVVSLQVNVDDDVNVTDPVPVPASIIVSVGLVMLNVAVTDCAALIVTTHCPVPEHPAPLQPANVEPEFCVAVSVTCDPLAKFAMHVLGHRIPDGELLTVPPPLPASVTVNAKLVVELKVAVTFSTMLIVTTQLPVPLHPPPLQPAKVLPLFGVSVKVTFDPLVKFAVHVLGHRIPEGLLDTVPLPVPASVTFSAKLEVELNVAVTVSPADSVTGILNEQVEAVVQGNVNPETPEADHPAKVEPDEDVAVSVTGQL